MNKIYKVLWSKTRNCYVVVSEFAKRSGKCSSSLNKKIIAAFLAAGAVMSVTGSAWADSVESDFFKATGDTEATANTTKSVAAGNAANAEGTYSVAVGNEAKSNGTGSVAIGDGAIATILNSIAIGAGAVASPTEEPSIQPVGTIAIGHYSSAEADKAIAIGQASKATAIQSYALGYKASAENKHSIALGTNSLSSGEFAIAIGGNAKSKGKNASAFGSSAIAEGEEAIAIGYNAKALKKSTIKIGGASAKGSVEGTGSIAIGHLSTAAGTSGYSTATGFKSLALNTAATTYGAASSASGFSVAVGYNSFAGTEKDGVLAKEIPNVTQATAVGYNSTASSYRASALGATSQATVDDGVALGSGAVADIAKEKAGYDPATGEASTKTDKVWQSKLGAVSVGNSTSTRQITNVAAGYEDTDAVNVAQLKAAMTSAGGVEIKPGSNISVDAQKKEGGGTVYTISSTASGGSNVKVINGKNTTVTEGKEGNFVTYAVDVMTDGKVTSGDTGIVTGETVFNEVRVKKDGNYIKKDNTAAENITELDKRLGENTQNITNIYNDVNNLDNRMKKGLAGAAALAALHPMDFNPDDKLQFSAGVGNYRGETAAALGAFYRPDESVMFSIGGTFGNADNMVNAGITFGLDGTRNRTTRSRTAMAKEIVELREHIAKQDEQIAQLTNLVNKLVAPEQRLENPFEPEQGRIYVERISGRDNDQNKIERVRVNNSDSKYPEGKNRDVYGSKIQPVVSKKAAGK